MEEDGRQPDAQLFQLLTSLLQQVESLSNQEEVELREKIEALGIEVTKVPPKPVNNLNELEIAAELDKLSAKLDCVDKMISSTMDLNPEVCTLLSNTAPMWLPVITASADQRRAFAVSNIGDDQKEEHDLDREKVE